MPERNLTPTQLERVNRGVCCAPSCGEPLPPPDWSGERPSIYCTETPSSCRSRAYRERKQAGMVRTLEMRAKERALERREELDKERRALTAQIGRIKRHIASIDQEIQNITLRYELPKLPLKLKDAS